jgi:PAS domain S-box-containing protein
LSGGPDERDSAKATGVADAAEVEESADDLYEHAPCGYLTTDEGGSIVRVNQTFLGWTGYRRDDVVGVRRIQDLLAPGDRIYYETHYAPLLSMQGSVREVAVEILRADGSRLPVLLNSVVKRRGDGAPPLIRTMVADATDRRRYERELLRARRDAEERARAVLALAHMNDGVLLVDVAGRVQLVNTAGAAMLGIAADSALGCAPADVISGWRAVEDRIPIGAPDRWPTPATLPFARANEEAWLAVAGVESGEGIVYTVRDVTADHRLEALRSDVVTVVSHELRTPLATMYGAAQTLLHHGAIDETLRERLLAEIVEQAEKQRRVLDAIALTNRLDSDEVELGTEEVDGPELVSQVAAVFRKQSSHKVVVESHAPVRVRADPRSAEQVLTNLVDNAVRYAPAGSRVTLCVGHLDGWGRFTVSDEGPGVPAAERELVFEKFYRLDPQQRTGVGGVGLGLYIARSLVTRMNGRIGLLPVDHGATFFFDLPLADPYREVPPA